MSHLTPHAGRTLRRIAAAALCLIGLAALSAPAGAWPEEREGADQPLRRPARARSAPTVPPPAIVSAYLPRNNNVPMYNEPPRRRPAW